MIPLLYKAAALSCFGLGMLLASLVLRRIGLRLWYNLAPIYGFPPPPCMPTATESMGARAVMLTGSFAAITPLLAFSPILMARSISIPQNWGIATLAIWAMIGIQMVLIRRLEMAEHHKWLWPLAWAALAHATIFAQGLTG